MKKTIYWTLATIAILYFYLAHYGLVTLVPTNINWLMSARHDWGTHYLGWAFYKNEPWHFPLGRIDAYNYPLGTNVGFTDSIPLMAIIFKVFAPLMPADFQYFGIWLLLCHLLTGYFAILLLRRFNVRWYITLLGALLIAVNPVLIYRGIHPALCAQWLLLACVYVYFMDPITTGIRKILLYQGILLALSALITPYLCWMVLGFTLILPIKLCYFDKRLSVRHGLVYLGLSAVTLFVAWFLLGLIQFQHKESLNVGGAYPSYAMNLNSLFNPGGYKRLLPELPLVSSHQYEGYMYLGAGLLLLLLFWLCYIACTRTGGKRGTYKSLIPLLALCLIYTILAVTLVFTFNDKVLVRIPAPKPFIILEEIFRACGRFFWLPYYLIILWTIIGISRIKANPLLPAALVTLAFIVQLYDMKVMLAPRHLQGGTYATPMKNKAWLEMMSQFDEILFLPPFQSPAIRPMDYQDFCYLALKAHKPINLAYVARSDIRGMTLYSDGITTQVASGHLSPKALYITSAGQLDYFGYPVRSKAASLHTLDGCYFLISTSANSTLLDTLLPRIDSENKTKLDSVSNRNDNKLEFAPVSKRIDGSNGGIRYNLEAVTLAPDFIMIHGWAVRDSTKDNTGDSVYYTLESGDRVYWAPATTSDRQDIASSFPGAHIVKAADALMAFTDSVSQGVYTLGITVKTKQGRYLHLQTKRTANIKIPEYPVPVKLTMLPPVTKMIYDLQVSDNLAEQSVDGWVAIPGRDADKATIQLLLKAGDATYAFDATPVERKDVTAIYKNKYNLDNTGFRIKIAGNTLPPGKYTIGFLIRDAARQDDHAMFTDRQLKIN